MKQNVIILIVVIVIIIFIVNVADKYVNIKSNVDGRIYRVRKNAMSQQSADLLAVINQRLEKLIEHSIKKIPAPVYKNNIKRFNSNHTSENILELDTTYTMNKGDSMVFCLAPRNKETIRLYDINTMMFVAIHELAHVASNSVGHTDEFKENFRSLLQDAIDIDLYTYVDYSKKPEEYCGITINSNIL